MVSQLWISVVKSGKCGLKEREFRVESEEEEHEEEEDGPEPRQRQP